MATVKGIIPGDRRSSNRRSLNVPIGQIRFVKIPMLYHLDSIEYGRNITTAISEADC